MVFLRPKGSQVSERPSLESSLPGLFQKLRIPLFGEFTCQNAVMAERFIEAGSPLEELIYTFGGPWLFVLLLFGLLILLALVMIVARMKFVGTDELPGPAPTQHGSQIDHSFPFLESLNEVLETNKDEESQSHVHIMYFMGPNTFSEPWHLPHSPPRTYNRNCVSGCFKS